MEYEYQLFIHFAVDENHLNARIIKMEIDKMPRPIKSYINVSQREIDQFTEQQYKEYGNVWLMPALIRDRIRSLRVDGRQTAESRRRGTIPRIRNTGVTRK